MSFCRIIVSNTSTLHVLNGSRPGYQVHSHGRYGEPIRLPEPFGFVIPTDEWPAYTDEG